MSDKLYTINKYYGNRNVYRVYIMPEWIDLSPYAYEAALEYDRIIRRKDVSHTAAWSAAYDTAANKTNYAPMGTMQLVKLYGRDNAIVFVRSEYGLGA